MMYEDALDGDREVDVDVDVGIKFHCRAPSGSVRLTGRRRSGRVRHVAEQMVDAESRRS
jgi:hypothetical protein